jgi:hypothetical protein
VSASGEVGEDAPVRSPESEIKDPFVLEFLGLKDEYSEAELEEALIRELEQFLLELGNDFAFIARQKRLRVGDEWCRVDLLFFHPRLRSLIVAELKLGRFTHADAGQMNLYLNYAREHWTNPDENPPIGLILCSEHQVRLSPGLQQFFAPQCPARSIPVVFSNLSYRRTDNVLLQMSRNIDCL